jgi:lipoate-protein ligase A
VLCVAGANRYGNQPGDESESTAAEPFLCVERRTEHDVVLGTAKIAGSAQRNRRGAVLQHGSVLLERSPLAPTLPGIIEASGDVSPGELFDAWLPLLAAGLGLSLPIVEATAAAQSDAVLPAAAVQAAAERLSSDDWIRRR